MAMIHYLALTVTMIEEDDFDPSETRQRRCATRSLILRDLYHFRTRNKGFPTTPIILRIEAAEK